MSQTNTENFLNWDLSTLSEAIQARKVSPVEVTKKLIEKIEESNEDLNAYITVARDEAISEAKQAENEINNGETRGPLHGVPIAIKDIIYSKDIKTTMGSEIYKDFVPDEDATVIEKLREAGAIIIGKLNTHQFAFGATGDRSYFGAVKNPHDRTKMTGGSSSGSGAAVAASLCYGALGTDTGGSIRIPASFNGIVGMKPTFGLVSKNGSYPLNQSMDHIGPMTRTVKDNALMLNVLAGYDERDLYSIQKEPEDYTRLLNKDINGSVIGIPSSNNHPYVHDEIKKSIDEAIETFRSLGAEIKEIDFPHMDKILAAFRMTITSEAYSVHEEQLEEKFDLYDEELRNRLLTGKPITAPEYIRAQHTKQWAIAEYDKILSEVDVILTPTMPLLPADIDQRDIDINGTSVHISLLLNHFTGPINLIGFPAISVPCGFSQSKLPIGLQLIGKPFDEANLYRFAAAFEIQTNK